MQKLQCKAKLPFDLHDETHTQLFYINLENFENKTRENPKHYTKEIHTDFSSRVVITLLLKLYNYKQSFEVLVSLTEPSFLNLMLCTSL